MSTTARDIATKAAKLVGADRARQYGDAREMHDAIATLWNAWLAVRRDTTAPINGSDVAKMMGLLKVARMERGEFNIDNFTDAVGYFAIAGDLAAREA